MSARERLMAAVSAALGGMAGLPVFDAPPVRGAVPYAVVGEPELKAFDAAGLTGRQARIVVELVDAGERPTRLRGQQDAIEERVLQVGGNLGEGWRLVSITLTRSRIARAGDTRWRGASEFAALMYRIDS